MEVYMYDFKKYQDGKFILRDENKQWIKYSFSSK